MKKKRNDIGVKHLRRVKGDKCDNAPVGVGSAEVRSEPRREDLQESFRRGNQSALG